MTLFAEDEEENEEPEVRITEAAEKVHLNNYLLCPFDILLCNSLK